MTDPTSTPAIAGTTPTPDAIRALAAHYEQQIVEWRRHFHRHPELGAHEVHTSEFIRAELARIGVPYRLVRGERPQKFQEERTDFIGTGIIATIAGTAPDAYNEDGTPKHRIALRTDMDALRVQERTGLPFASEAEGLMHACGHDCHMAMMLGAVHVLWALRDRLHGEVRVIFQPAEEISIGARDMIAAGALDGVEAIYGAHIWSEVDAGTVSCQPGPRMANTDWFRIDIQGASAHGSMPHKGVDAIVIACQIVESLQVLVSRDTSPFEPIVVTVGEIHGGTARNIMAGSAYLTGTLRTWHTRSRKNAIEEIDRISRKIAHAFGAEYNFTFEAGNPNVVNDEHCSEVASRAVEEVLGADALASYEGTLAGEDFAEYLQVIPGVFAFVGTRNPAVGAQFPQHSCYYTIDESVLAKGSMVAAQWACDMLA